MKVRPSVKKMCDKCLIRAKLKEQYNKTIKSSNENLLDELIRAASNNNEYDNRSELNLLREQVLKRMK